MADTTFGFGNGSQYSSTGQALNTQAQTDLTNLGVSGNTYSSYVPPNTSTPTPVTDITAPTTNYASTIAHPDANGTGLVSGMVTQPVQAQTPTSDTSSLDKAVTDQYTTDLTKSNQLESDLTTQRNDLLGKGQAEQDLATQYGATPEAMKSIQDLTTSIAQRTGQFQQAIEATRNQPVLSVIADRQQAALNRQQAIEIGAMNATLSALKGNFQLAQDQATRTVNLQFADKEQKIANTEKFLALNKDNLTRDEKAKADILKNQVTQQKANLVTEKANVKTALTNGVQTQFWTKPDGTVVRTEDGVAFSNPQDAIAAGVLPDFSNAPKINPVGKSETKTINGQVLHVTYDQHGNVLSQTNLGVAGKGKGSGSGSGGTLTTYQPDSSGKLWKVTTKNGVQTSKVEQKPTAGTTAPSSKIQGMLSDINATATGADHALSPDDWNQALNQWLSQGYSLSSFKSNFGSFAKNSNYFPINSYTGM